LCDAWCDSEADVTTQQITLWSLV